MSIARYQVYLFLTRNWAQPGFLALVLFGLPFAGVFASDTTTGTVGVTISDGGSVGGPTTPPPTTTSTGSTANTSTTNGGGAISQSAAVEQQGISTFRPVPSVGPVTVFSAGDAATDSAATDTTTDLDTAGGRAPVAPQAPRMPKGARSIGNLTGGVSSVAVTGSPNQTYGISLPGQTVIVQGSQTMAIDGFVHNAGDTPAMNASGTASFNVGVKVSGEGGGEGGAGAGDASGGGTGGSAIPENFDGPVIPTTPFMDVIISYN